MRRECFLRLTRLIAQSSTDLLPQRIATDLNRIPRSRIDHRSDVVHQHLVEQFPADVLVAARPTNDCEPAVTSHHHGRIERAATEVVDHDGAAGLDAHIGGERQRSRDRFGNEHGVRQAGLGARLHQAVDPRLVPRRRMGEPDLLRWLTDLQNDLVVDLSQQRCHECHHLVRAAAQDGWRLLAESVLERAKRALRMCDRQVVSRATHDDLPVGGDQHHGRHPPLACEINDLWRPLPHTGRGNGVARSEVDGEDPRSQSSASCSAALPTLVVDPAPVGRRSSHRIPRPITSGRSSG